PDRDASYVNMLGDANDLGASGLMESPAKAAEAAAAATPKFPNPLTRDPGIHLLRRTTYRPTPQDLTAAPEEGIDAWIDRQLAPDQIDDKVAARLLDSFPTVGMTTEQVRKTVPMNDQDAMQELGRATLARQIWSNRQLYEIMVDLWSNHLNVTN